MAKRKNKSNQSKTLLLFILGLGGLGLLIAILLSDTDVALFNPRGLIAKEEFKLMMMSAALMLSIGIPTLILLYFFAWKYRETNEKSKYAPNARHGKFFVFSLWAIPSIFVVILASVMWPAAHRLDQHKPITSKAKPLTIQVVAMRWKWLFIYPDQNISTVNFVQIPTDTPIQFELTADETPMSSFWIPHLGGQLYAMTGHMNQLNLLADTAGDYPGSSAEINGAGFSGMKFVARASSKADFDLWVKDVQLYSKGLDSAEYAKLLTPSENTPAVSYATTEAGLYDKVLTKYMAGSHHHTTEAE